MSGFNKNYLSKECQTTSVDYREHFQELGDQIYSGKILTDVFCEDILQRVRYFDEQANVDCFNSANSMHQSALLSTEIGIDRLVRSFVDLFVRDIAPQILSERLRLPIDEIHSYIIRYGQSLGRELGFHVDDSFLTLNICLNEGFTGSELVFEGERCPTHVDYNSSENERVCINHKKGAMVVHPGKNRHFVNYISSGKRCSLIIWCQNKAERERWFDAQKSGECLEFCREFSPEKN